MLQIPRDKKCFIGSVRQRDCIKRHIVHIWQYDVHMPGFKKNTSLCHIPKKNIDRSRIETELCPMQDLEILFKNRFAENGNHGGIEEFFDDRYRGRINSFRK